MQDRLISKTELDRTALVVRPLLVDPPWQRLHDREEIDTGVQALFRRYRPGIAPHRVPPEMLGAVWTRHRELLDLKRTHDALEDDVADPIIERAALMLHLLARGPVPSPEGRELGAACAMEKEVKADKKNSRLISDTRFARLMSTRRSQRLEALSRLMRRLKQAGSPLRWFHPDKERKSNSRNIRDLRTDEVLPILNFLFGYDADPSVARWAAGFYGTRDATETDAEAEPTAESA